MKNKFHSKIRNALRVLARVCSRLKLRRLREGGSTFYASLTKGVFRLVSPSTRKASHPRPALAPSVRGELERRISTFEEQDPRNADLEGPARELLEEIRRLSTLPQRHETLSLQESPERAEAALGSEPMQRAVECFGQLATKAASLHSIEL